MRTRKRTAGPGQATEWRPVRIIDVDLASPPTTWGVTAEDRVALAVGRLHTHLLGVTMLDVGPAHPADVIPGALAARLATQVEDHVTHHGCPAQHPTTDHPPCLARRERRLARAPSASVVIATRERPALLEACLDSVLDQDHPALEVIVVDNARASDATERLIRSKPSWADRVRYVREDDAGLAKAHNAALPHVRGDVVAITDDDVVVDRHWLGAVLDAFVSHDVQCVTGAILPLELRTREQAWVEQYGGFVRGFRERVFSIDNPPPGDKLFPFTAGRFGSGANMAFARGLLSRMGGFDPALGAGTRARGGDDLAAFARAVLGGARLAYTPHAIVRHRHHEDFSALRRMAHGYGMGLGAYVTSLLASEPRLAPEVLRRVPAAISHLVRADSAKNQRIRDDYPRALVRAERLGLLRGPIGYGLSRWDCHRGARTASRLAAPAEPAAGGVAR